jgi:hypothetical protein
MLDQSCRKSVKCIPFHVDNDNMYKNGASRFISPAKVKSLSLQKSFYVLFIYSLHKHRKLQLWKLCSISFISLYRNHINNLKCSFYSSHWKSIIQPISQIILLHKYITLGIFESQKTIFIPTYILHI